MASAKAVAAYMIQKANRMGNGNPELSGNNDLTNLKLQKMLYFAQVEYMKTHNGRVLFPDDIEAWQYGPVVKSVYEMLKHCQSYVISEFDVDLTLAEGLDDDEVTFLDGFCDKYLKYSAWELVEKTHKTGSSWDQVYKGGRGNHEVIPVEMMA